jgi:hypothetical protein
MKKKKDRRIGALIDQARRNELAPLPPDDEPVLAQVELIAAEWKHGITPSADDIEFLIKVALEYVLPTRRGFPFGVRTPTTAPQRALRYVAALVKLDQQAYRAEKNVERAPRSITRGFIEARLRSVGQRFPELQDQIVLPRDEDRVCKFKVSEDLLDEVRKLFLMT